MCDYVEKFGLIDMVFYETNASSNPAGVTISFLGPGFPKRSIEILPPNRAVVARGARNQRLIHPAK